MADKRIRVLVAKPGLMDMIVAQKLLLVHFVMQAWKLFTPVFVRPLNRSLKQQTQKT